MKTEPAAEVKRIRFGDTRTTIERNKQILKLLAEDKRPKEIAEDLEINLKTIRWAIEWMRHYNGYQSIAALVAAAIRGNMI
jgi:DNA-binding CsgD family transcriptional regulator